MRESSSSITQLVKIVAREVVEEYMKEKVRLFHRSADDVCREMQFTMEKAGRKWSPDEDELLLTEIKTAIAQMAKNHGRSYTAIRLRVQDKDIFGKNCEMLTS